MDLNLRGKTALVTGSTAGIGLGIAARLAQEGVHVAIVGRTPDKLAAAAADLAASGRITPILADAAAPEGAATIFAALPEVDILVNNLGIYQALPFAEIDDDAWRRMFEVNVLSGVRLARHYFPRMLANDWGRVIFISSESGLVIPAEMVHYGMTKTALLAVSRGLAEQTRGTGVTVNSVLPGPTRSEGIVEFIRATVGDAEGTEAEVEAAFFTKMRPASLIKRLITADEVGAIVAYLASPLAAATNGAALRVEGGLVPTIG